MKKYYEQMIIWDGVYTVYKDRYHHYYFLKDNRWITPAHMRYYPKKYPFTLTDIFSLCYGPMLEKMVMPDQGSIMSLLKKDDIWQTGVVLSLKG